MSGLRLILGVEVAAGNESHADTALPGLVDLIERLPLQKPPKPPKLVRGDMGAGGDGGPRSAPDALAVSSCGSRRTSSATSKGAGQGWRGQDGELKLSGRESCPARRYPASPAAGRIAASDGGTGLQLVDLFVRLAQAQLEANTSRPLLLSGIGRLTIITCMAKPRTPRRFCCTPASDSKLRKVLPGD
jgi:hypothetical protein